MKAPGKNSGGGFRGEGENLDTLSAPLTHISCVPDPCLSCDYQVSGVSHGTPCRFCCHPEILRGYAKKSHTSYETRIVSLADAWPLCNGTYFLLSTPAGADLREGREIYQPQPGLVFNASLNRHQGDTCVCPGCGEAFVPDRVSQLYCSARCRTRVYRKRRKEAGS